MKFRKKPVVIEAFRWEGHSRPLWPAWMEAYRGPHGGRIHHGDAVLEIPTLEGTMTARYGDWIIRGVHGEVYPCKPDIFEATYDPIGLDSKEKDCREDPWGGGVPGMGGGE